jgi:predicted nucleic acid-binding protein
MTHLIKATEEIYVSYLPFGSFSIFKDKSDYIFPNLADESKADYIIIIGNINDFNMSQFARTKIATPKEFCELYQPNTL